MQKIIPALVLALVLITAGCLFNAPPSDIVEATPTATPTTATPAPTPAPVASAVTPTPQPTPAAISVQGGSGSAASSSPVLAPATPAPGATPVSQAAYDAAVRNYEQQKAQYDALMAGQRAELDSAKGATEGTMKYILAKWRHKIDAQRALVEQAKTRVDALQAAKT